jgi:hypothetical protein
VNAWSGWSRQALFVYEELQGLTLEYISTPYFCVLNRSLNKKTNTLNIGFFMPVIYSVHSIKEEISTQWNQ